MRGLFFSKLLAGEHEAARWQSSIAAPDAGGAPAPSEAPAKATHGLTLYPAIDLKDGACVRLRRGEMEDATHYSDDPAAQARLFEEAGCRHVHVVDLNGAFAGKSTNIPAIESIVKATNLPVQLGGGIRDMAAIERWLEAGVSRIILGSVAVKDPELVRQAARAFPGQIVAGIDARQGRVATEGWAEVSELEANDLALRMEDAGVAAIIFTEITRDGMLAGLDLEQTADMARRLSIPVIASGGVGTLDHLKDLREIARTVPGISGAIVGRALYDGRIALKDALDVLGSC
ncbi:1-(5-phosphoribosyl)-5-[(5-phosphoribosylamino) methylideneamino] imidazole-4-carboxamide isomerase [Gluconobacter frateurii NBRC 103465]|nr:1-(5-phosphoribosyl)-5-[(5-phosphoribosylamino) methylideneamino] imidazole-4-carboxamide isomerase [Gluconobacter frateurii NBRC 103465]